MLKYIKNHMISNGIEIYPLISFLLFFSFFVLMLVFVFRQDKKHIKEMGNLPLNDDKNTQP